MAVAGEQFPKQNPAYRPTGNLFFAAEATPQKNSTARDYGVLTYSAAVRDGAGAPSRALSSGNAT